MMKRSFLRLGVLLLVLVPVSLQSAKAATCFSCICVQGCETSQQSCLNRCGSDQTCRTNCGTTYENCLDRCLS